MQLIAEKEISEEIMPNAVHVSTVHSAYDPRIVFKEIDSLIELGWEVSYVCSDPQIRESTNRTYMKIPRSRSRLGRLLVDGRAAWKAALRLRPDIIHFHDPELLLGVFLYSRRTSAKIVFDIHEYYLESIANKRWIPDSIKNLVRWLVSVVEIQAFKVIDGLVVVSDRMATMYDQYSKPIAILPNYPRRNLFHGELLDPTLECRYAGKKVIIYVGNLSKTRGLERIVSVFPKILAEVPEAFLLIIGKSASPAFETELRRKLERTIPSGKWEMTGYIPHERIFGYLKIANAGFFLPDSEVLRYGWGEPTKYFEYCAAGLPVVMSDSEVKRRLMEKGKNGLLVVPEDEDAVVSAFIAILNDQSLALDFKANGLKAFEESFSWESCFPSLLGLYSALLSR